MPSQGGFFLIGRLPKSLSKDIVEGIDRFIYTNLYIRHHRFMGTLLLLLFVYVCVSVGEPYDWTLCKRLATEHGVCNLT